MRLESQIHRNLPDYNFVNLEEFYSNDFQAETTKILELHTPIEKRRREYLRIICH